MVFVEPKLPLCRLARGYSIFKVSEVPDVALSIVRFYACSPPAFPLRPRDANDAARVATMERYIPRVRSMVDISEVIEPIVTANAIDVVDLIRICAAHPFPDYAMSVGRSAKKISRPIPIFVDIGQGSLACVC
ncbi:hypothetical protein FHS82_001088 [Pseudochelatococcus lubricantis]|uniref:Uncharacterized protein n=1 Tax=Pseudochelatococcus lubricantis TaxID=1538102 RepID=A0ABX0UWD1_9HYPH|nr:hypothetical protein [Pseudochelatococcus lubricantis]NIJ57262.1 hypothetical protein [Pseudochelatococcus lubricantis]